jgi:hypothetical protein
MATSYALDQDSHIPPPSLIIRLLLGHTLHRAFSNYAIAQLGGWRPFSSIMIFLPMQLATHFAAEMQTALADNVEFCGLNIFRVQGEASSGGMTYFAKCNFAANVPPFLSGPQDFPHKLSPEQELRLERFRQDLKYRQADPRYYLPGECLNHVKVTVFPGKKTPEDRIWPDPSYANLEYFLTSITVLPCLPQLNLPLPVHLPRVGFADFLEQTMNTLAQNLHNKLDNQAEIRSSKGKGKGKSNRQSSKGPPKGSKGSSKSSKGKSKRTDSHEESSRKGDRDSAHRSSSHKDEPDSNDRESRSSKWKVKRQSSSDDPHRDTQRPRLENVSSSSKAAFQ